MSRSAAKAADDRDRAGPLRGERPGAGAHRRRPRGRPRAATRSGMVGVGGRIPLGYYKDPEKTAKTFRTVNGVRYSIPGDYATVDADGTIRLLGRGSATVNTGGEKVYPEEVELVLREHAAVDDCVVVGVPDVRFGEMVVAMVGHATDTRSTKTTLRAHCQTRGLAGYKIPERVVIRSTTCSARRTARPTTSCCARSAADRSRSWETRMMADHFVIDGSNLATEGRTEPSLAQLREAVDAFRGEHPGRDRHRRRGRELRAPHRPIGTRRVLQGRDRRRGGLATGRRGRPRRRLSAADRQPHRRHRASRTTRSRSSTPNTTGSSSRAA